MASSPIRVHLVSFGPLRSIFPDGGQWREIFTGDSVTSLLARLQAEGILEESMLHSLAIAVNERYAHHDQTLEDGDEIAILPPVSGGAPELVALIRKPIETAAIQNAVKACSDGAVSVFDGIVRNNTRGRQTLHLDYEGYEAMALRQMYLLRSEAIERFGVREVAIVHRLGRLVVGETSVLIAVASAHRGTAFDACRWVIDTLKKTVPIWKKEQFLDGALWADGEPFPDDVAGTQG